MSINVQVFFNFRSPYCYLVSQNLFETLDRFSINLQWRPLGGWDGRSAPDRAKTKLPIARQDVSRWCRRLSIPFTPPPVTTDPTNAALASLAAERLGRLAEYVKRVMAAEWSEGKDIGELEVLHNVWNDLDLDPNVMISALESNEYLTALSEHWSEAQALGVFGVPTFVVGDEIFWGNDRLDFLAEHLNDLGVAK